LKTNEVKLSTTPNFHWFRCATVLNCHFYFVIVPQQAQADAHVSASQQDKGKGKKSAESGRGKRKGTNQHNVQPKKKPNKWSLMSFYDYVASVSNSLRPVVNTYVHVLFLGHMSKFKILSATLIF
jgi:hypothetical protein